ncbi:MAG: VWA domain-containing protein [Pseudomonadota bacterium]
MRKTLVKQYAENADGNMAMMGGLCLSLILMGAVATIDYSMATNNGGQSQNVADSLSLAAAIQMGKKIEENRGREGLTLPTEIYVEGKEYSAKDLGFAFSGLAEDTDAKVTFKYNLEENEVQATVTGYSKANFMGMMGVDKIPFSSVSTAEFPSPQIQFPVSIAMVIDNSNSMWSDEDPSAPWDQAHYDHHYNIFRNDQRKNHDTSDDMARQVPTGLEKRPPGTKQRISSLRTALTSLNDTLYDAVLGEVDQRYMRTGLIPFNHNFISSKSSRMNWGTLPASKISGMSPSGETDTSRGMDKAWNWLKNEHNQFDSTMRDDLKRYVILMTDGQNTTNRTVQIDKPGSGVWRGQVQRTRNGYTDNSRPCTQRQTRYRNIGEAGRVPYQACVAWGPPRNRWVPPATYWAWTTKRQSARPSDGRNWKEVDWVDRTRHTCDKMHKEGWTVFTIGYALTQGIFQRNLPGRPANEYWATDPTEVAKAKELLEYCATSEEHHITASNAEQLNEAFEEIGREIATDSSIRIKM